MRVLATFSAGFIGSKYDIIVDSYIQPKTTVGVFEGSGKIFFDLDEAAQKNLESVEDFIKESNQVS